uniref:Uncharacterized protein n=2 Tax=viral metagenome TaxID=1070528 RepID=A0A6M3Y3Y9_9ZZZZ
MGGIGSGRKRGSGISRTKALKRMSQLAPIAVITIEETIKGTNKDRLRYEAAVEVYNHNFGKAKQSTELEIRGGEDIGVGFLSQYLTILEESKREFIEGEYKMIEGGNDAVQRQGDSQEVLEGQKEETTDVQP